MRIGLVVPHIFMQRAILKQVIFSPGELAVHLAEGLAQSGHAVTLFTPGPVDTSVPNQTADLSLFEHELALRGDDYLDLLKKHPLTFINLARQVQSELVASAYQQANAGDFDLIHIYGNEEEIALPFAALCAKPVVFTHHDPFNFQVKYRSLFPRYSHLNWIALSAAQRRGMPVRTNWLATIHHGLPPGQYQPVYQTPGSTVLFMGRIISSKGTHLAVQAVQAYNRAHPERPLTLQIAGKHYNGQKDTYWRSFIDPQLADPHVSYLGHVRAQADKQRLLGQAGALLMPSTFEEPFGLVMIEALACATPVIGLASGAIPEVIKEGKTGWLTPHSDDPQALVAGLVSGLERINQLDRRACRADFEQRFTIERMSRAHAAAYAKLIK